MTDNNRTERRLLDSIRKAKTGPDAETVAPTTAADHGAPPAKVPAPRSMATPAKAAASKTPTTTRKAPARPSSKTAQRAASGASDINRFQRGGRVWPD